MLYGLAVALKILRERRTVNQQSAIFLFSDGKAKSYTYVLFREMLSKKENENIGPFSLYSFGFGEDCDHNLMKKISSIKDGNFQFIDRLTSLDWAFQKALGGKLLVSNINIKIQSTISPIQGVIIQRVYGQNWKKINDKSYELQVNQLMSSISQSFLFQLFIPSTKIPLQYVNRPLEILKASFTGLGNKQNKIQGQTLLRIQIPSDDATVKRESNSQVIENTSYQKQTCLLRSQIDELKKQTDEMRKQIDDMIETIKYHPKIRKEKAIIMPEDLESAKHDYNQCVSGFAPLTFYSSQEQPRVSIFQPIQKPRIIDPKERKQ